MSNLKEIGYDGKSYSVPGPLSMQYASITIGARTGQLWKYGKVVFFAEPSMETVANFKASAIPEGFRPTQYVLLTSASNHDGVSGAILVNPTSGEFLTYGYNDTDYIYVSGCWITP